MLRGGVTAFHSLYRRSFVYTRRLWAGSCPLYTTMSVIVKFEFQSWFKDGGTFVSSDALCAETRCPVREKNCTYFLVGKDPVTCPNRSHSSYPPGTDSEATGDVTRLTKGSPTRYVLSLFSCDTCDRVLDCTVSVPIDIRTGGEC